MAPTGPSLRRRLTAVAHALRDLLVTDLDARLALGADVEHLAASLRERDARARVALRLVQEVLRTDKDVGDRQQRLQNAAASLADAVARYLGARGEERITILEPAERELLSLLRQLPVSSPLLAPRTSDFTSGSAGERSSGGGVKPSAASQVTAEAPLAPEADRTFLAEFVDEARECIASAEAALLALERAPRHAEASQAALRAFHSLKGTAGFLGLTRIVELAHETESLLDAAMGDGNALGAGAAALALEAVDVLGGLVRGVEAGLGGTTLPEPPACAPLLARMRRWGVGGDDAAGTPAADEEAVPGSGASTSPAAPPAAADEATTRVRTDRLDRLLELVGELVVAQWMIVQDPAVRADPHTELAKKVARASKIGRELHEIGLGLRLIPIRGACRKLARVARDVARQSGKRVEWMVEGEATELDRNLVELLTDPLVHMVRNAVDHGIEEPAERAALGKREAGTVRLRAHQADGCVVLELSDDGRGLQRAAILERASALGLAAPGEVLEDEAVLDLIFAPGMSTARALTEVSGRGVGMDVVRRNVQALHGRIEVRSTPGAGTTFVVRVPLTLAITEGMLVRVGAERYIVPTMHVVLTFRPEAPALGTVAGRGEVVRVRHELLPVVRLHRLFEVPGAAEDPTAGVLMVIAAGERRAAMLVDEVLGQQQAVAKPVGDALGDVPGVAGAAVLGDGRVGLVLDVARLLHTAPRAAPIVGPGAGQAVA